MAAHSSLQLNYWLSAFFGWLPALIFYLVEKDRHPLQNDHQREVLNFQLTSLIVTLAMIIPFIGWVVGGIGAIVYFVLGILGAIKGPDAFRAGQPYRFPLTIRFIS